MIWSPPEIAISPSPSGGAVPLLVGASAPGAIRRAARLGDGYIAGYLDAVPAYLEALDECGKMAATGRFVVNHWGIIAEDPQRAWAEIGPHAVHQLNRYVARGGWNTRVPRSAVPTMC